MTGANRVLAAKHEGIRPHGTLRHRCKDNIKMDIQGIGWRGGVYGLY
jgi:hypothetical protein